MPQTDMPDDCRPEGAARGVWVWLPDRSCLVDVEVASQCRSKRPLTRKQSAEGKLKRPRSQSDELSRSRSLSKAEIRERMSSCSQEMLSPRDKVPTPETPSSAAFMSKRKERQKQQAALDKEAPLDKQHGASNQTISASVPTFEHYVASDGVEVAMGP